MAEKSEVDKIRISINSKLIVIISIIIVVSLGSITTLVSWFIYKDLCIAAEKNNFEVNGRSAMEAEIVLSDVRSNSRILMQTINAARNENDIAKESVNFFFTEHPQIAALYFIIPGRHEQLLINKKYFTDNKISETFADSYFKNHSDALGRSLRGETMLLNSAPHFSRPVLAMFFPWYNGGVGGVIFSCENLNNIFGIGANVSYMINSSGDVLAHSDISMVNNGTNIADNDIIASIFKSSDRAGQQLIDTDLSFIQTSINIFLTTIGQIRKFFVVTWNNVKSNIILLLKGTDKGALQNIYQKNNVEPVNPRRFIAYTKLNVAGAVVITSFDYNKIFDGIAAVTRRNIYLTIAVLCISLIFVIIFLKTISIKSKDAAVQKNG